MLVVHAITTMVDYFQDGVESVPSWELRVECWLSMQSLQWLITFRMGRSLFHLGSFMLNVGCPCNHYNG